MGEEWPFKCGTYSIMDCSYRTVHLDPFEKLKLGWVSPIVITEGGVHSLRDVETGRRILILYDPKHGAGEYLLVENRFRGSSYDAGTRHAGGGIAADGLAIWHIVEDPALFD